MAKAFIENLSAETLRRDREWKKLLQDSFPADELEDWDTVVRALEMGTGIALRAVVNGKTIGLSTLNWLNTVHSSFLGYIAVGQKSNGLGSDLLGENKRYTSERYGKDTVGMFAEMERPDMVLPHGDEHRIRMKRLAFFVKKNDAVVLEDNYRQPPLREGMPEVPLHLLYIPCTSEVKDIGMNTRQSVVKAMYRGKYRDVNNIPDSVLRQSFLDIWPTGIWEPDAAA